MKISRTWALLALFFVVDAVAVPASAQTPQTIFQFVSAPGDYIGQGQTVVLTPAVATFNPQVTGNPGLVLIDLGNNGPVAPGGQYITWAMGFSTATGAPLTVGSYPNASGSPFQDGISPGMDIYGDGRGCDRIFGHFDILDIAYDPVSGALSRFAANFTQSCELSTAPPLVGAIRFNSSVPVPELIVPIINLTTSKNIHGCVEATSPTGGTAALTASAAGGADLTYTWATSNGAKATGLNFSPVVSLKSGVTVALTATDGITGARATTSMTLCASDTTPPAITIKSPVQGATYEQLPEIDIHVNDVVDKNIKQVGIVVGESAAYPLDKAGRADVRLTPRHAINDHIQTQITVTAADASGNTGSATVQVLLKVGAH
jgi:hypothetical protein